MEYLLKKSNRMCVILGLILFILSITPLNTQDIGYLTTKAYEEEFCFDYYSGWDTEKGKPGEAPVILSQCQAMEAIRIDGAEFIRPDDRGDECGGTTDCCRATGDDCIVDVGSQYSGLYQSIKNNCEGQNRCHIFVPSVSTDSHCGNRIFWKCRTNNNPLSGFEKDVSCYARRIKVIYACVYDPGATPPTETVTIATPKTSTKIAVPLATKSGNAGPVPVTVISATQDSSTEALAKPNLADKQDEKRVGMIVGASLTALLVLVAFMIVMVVIISKRLRYHTKKFLPKKKNNVPPTDEQIDPEYANQISRWDEPPPDNVENSPLQQKEEANDTYDRIKGKPTNINYMLMSSVSKPKKPSCSMSSEKSEEETYLNGKDTMPGADREMDYVRCDSVDQDLDKEEVEVDEEERAGGRLKMKNKEDTDTDAAASSEERTYYNQLDLSKQRDKAKKPAGKGSYLEVMKDSVVCDSTEDLKEPEGCTKDKPGCSTNRENNHYDQVDGRKQIAVGKNRNIANENVYEKEQLSKINGEESKRKKGVGVKKNNGASDNGNSKDVPVSNGAISGMNIYENVKGNGDTVKSVGDNEGDKKPDLERTISEDHYDAVDFKPENEKKVSPQNGIEKDDSRDTQDVPTDTQKGDKHYSDVYGHFKLEGRQRQA